MKFNSYFLTLACSLLILSSIEGHAMNNEDKEHWGKTFIKEARIVYPPEDLPLYLFRSRLDDEMKDPVQVSKEFHEKHPRTGPGITRAPSYLGVCFTYAKERLQLHKMPDFELHSKACAQYIRENFDVVDTLNKAKENDLVVYYTNEEDDYLFTHFGVMQDDGRVRSKWGRSYLYDHPIHYVGHSFGRAKIFRKKN